MPSNSTKTVDSPQALDRPLKLTRFPSQKALVKKELHLSLRTLAGKIERQTAASKDKLPWLKLATFGNTKSDKGCLRTNANVATITGLEADYDAGRMTPEEARDKLAKADIAAVIYTTPSHTTKAPRWRVLSPFSGPLPPEAREDHMARLNGVFGGTLDPASFTLSQAYYAGGVDGGPKVRTFLVDGQPIDKARGLKPIYKNGGGTKPDPIAAEPPEDQSNIPEAVQRAEEMLEYAKDKIMQAEERTPIIYQQAFQLGGFVACNTLDPEDVLDELLEAAEAVGHQATYGEDGTKRTILNGLADGEKFPLIWIDSVSRIDRLFDEMWTPEELAKSEREAKTDNPRLTFLSPSECEDLPARRYVIKGLLAEGDIATIVGAPGAGKSLLAPYLGYAVARGDRAFGRRTRQGGVLYVAAEDSHGMRSRLKALREEHGDADSFKLVEGVSDLLTPNSPDLKALAKAAKAMRPALIVIDTMAVAFPGLEENDAKSMGQVVAVARHLTRWGAAVVLIHHDTKDGGNGLPRGHSILNGALDSNLYLKRHNGVVTGKLTKNRNGSTDEELAFTVEVMPFGEDEDGDPKTAAFCREADASTIANKPITLTSKQEAALCTLAELLGAGDGVPIAEWRKACIDNPSVSAAEQVNDRRKTFRRIFEELAQKQMVFVYDQKAFLDKPVERSFSDDDV